MRPNNQQYIQTWLPVRLSVLKINFSVLSNLLFLFIPMSEPSFFSCIEKVAGICYPTINPINASQSKWCKSNKSNNEELHTEAGYDIFTSYQVCDLSPCNWYMREPICNGSVSFHSSFPTVKTLISPLWDHQSIKLSHFQEKNTYGQLIVISQTWSKN